MIVLMSSTVTAADLDVLERVGTALADRTRRQILVRLLEGPAYPAELAELLDAGRANISNHLACLRGCGLVTTTRQGTYIRYQLAHRRLAHALRLLSTLPLAIQAGHPDLDGRP
jgi:ArsR family transcriptional regulator, cadmium/lead-responsive transcriptional repressor